MTLEHTAVASPATAPTGAEPSSRELHDEAPGTPPPRRRWPWAVAVVAVCLLGAGIALWAFVLRGDDTTTTAATTTRQLVAVTSGAMGTSVSAQGTVAAAHTEDLSFSAAGTVKTVNVAAGDTVTAGQVLATIDSSQLAAAVADAKSQVAKAEAKLSDDKAASASDEQIAADTSALTSAQDSLAAAETAQEGAQLTASIDGVVTTVDLTVGEQLGNSGTGGTTATGTATGSGQSASTLGSAQRAGPQAVGSSGQSSSSSTPQVQIVSSGHYTVQLAVDSSDISKIAAGQSATLTISTSTNGSSSSGFGGFPGGGQGGGPPGSTGGTSANQSNRSSGGSSRSSTSDVTVTGTVTTVGRVADASSGVATYPVTVAFDADATKVFVGSTATAAIDVSQRNDVIQVPARAVTTSGGQSVVTVSTDGATADGATEQRTVTTGETANGMVEITSGLKAGEQVVIEVPGFPGGGQPPGAGELPAGFTPPGVQGGTGSGSASNGSGS